MRNRHAVLDTGIDVIDNITVVNGRMLKENNQQEQPLTRENDTQEKLLLNESAKIEEHENAVRLIFLG